MDKLNELFQEWQAKNPSGDLFQAFQGGLTAGAVSMRERAMKAADSGDFDAIRNKIGQLSDIPE